MTDNSDEKKGANSSVSRIYDACPHCGRELSPWQQVLLTIDHALVCRNCWYRIILDISEEEESVFPLDDKE